MNLDDKIKQKIIDKELENNSHAIAIIDNAIEKLSNNDYEILGGNLVIKIDYNYQHSHYTEDVESILIKLVKTKIGYNYRYVAFRNDFIAGLILTINRTGDLWI